MNRSTMLLSVLGLVLLAALWWLFVFSPGQEELADVEAEITSAEAEQRSLELRVAALEAVRARAPETEAAIVRLRSLVPDDPAIPGALRQIQAAADDAGVAITTISTARPSVEDEPTGLHSVAVALSVDGSYFQLVDFMRRLEDPEVTSRGISFGGLSLSTGEYPTLTATVTGSLYSVLEPVPEPVGETAPPPPSDGEDEEGAS